MRILLAGATGTIGRAVLVELLRRRYDVVVVCREGQRSQFDPHHLLTVCEGDWIGRAGQLLPDGRFDVVVSCIASRTGGPLDAWYVDYFANLRLLDVARERYCEHFQLLSAICVQRPMLAFQREKLRFEAALASSGITYSIIRPTAFFKSLSGQLARVRRGRSFLVFGDGRLTACKPISERDLAAYMVNRLEDGHSGGRILPIGGPGRAITPLDQAEMIVRLFGPDTGITRISPRLFDVLGMLVAPTSGIGQWGADRREFFRIAKYYATESMLYWDAQHQRYDADLTPETGEDTLEHYYEQLRDGVAELPDKTGGALFS